MLNYNAIHNRIIRKMACSSNQAWSAIAQAYLTMDKSMPEHWQANYLYHVGCYRVLDDYYCYNVLDRANAATAVEIKILQGRNEDFEITEDDLFKAPPAIEEDIDYILDLVRRVPDQYRIPVTVVVTELLKNDERKRKPLTVEMTRQYLKKNHVANTSEMARQVYTYLTTLNK
jgi:hypothetical protein